MTRILACLLMLVPDACAYPERPSYGFSAIEEKPQSGMLSHIVSVAGVQCNTHAAKLFHLGDQILILNGINVSQATSHRYKVALDILKNPKVPIEGKILRINGGHKRLIDFNLEARLVKGPFVKPEKC